MKPPAESFELDSEDNISIDDVRPRPIPMTPIRQESAIPSKLDTRVDQEEEEEGFSQFTSARLNFQAPAISPTSAKPGPQMVVPSPNKFRVAKHQNITENPHSLSSSIQPSATSTQEPVDENEEPQGLWKRVFSKSSKLPVITDIKKLSNNVRSISSTQFKQQIVKLEQLSAHRPANLYDPHGDNTDHSLMQNVQDARMSFLAFQQRLHIFLEDPSSSFSSLVFNLTLIILIILATVGMFLESIPEYQSHDNEAMWFTIDFTVTIIFTVELCMRLIARATSWRTFIQFIFSFLFVVDMIAVVPFYVEMSKRQDDRNMVVGVLTGLRLVRIFRLLKMFRYFNQVRYIELSFEVAGEAIRKSIGPLFPMFFAAAIAVIILSTLIFYAERGVYDPKLKYFVDVNGNRSKFESIPKTIWFSVTTITTVGYGDMSPLTFYGRLLTFSMMIAGMLLIALPSIIIGRNFSILWHTLKSKNAVPPKPEWLLRVTGRKGHSKKYRRIQESVEQLADQPDEEGGSRHGSTNVLNRSSSEDEIAYEKTLKKDTEKSKSVLDLKSARHPAALQQVTLKSGPLSGVEPKAYQCPHCKQSIEQSAWPAGGRLDSDLYEILLREIQKANENITKIIDQNNEFDDAGFDDEVEEDAASDGHE